MKRKWFCAGRAAAVLLAFPLFVAAPRTLQACSIFVGSDGQNVLVGNNEDDGFQPNYSLFPSGL